MACDLEVSAFYLDRDRKHLEEKPYELRFPPPPGFASKNSACSEYGQIKVTDIRGKESEFTIDKYGFEICILDSTLSPDDFEDRQRVEAVFLKEVAHCLKDKLKAKRVLVFDYSRRKSIPGYPISTGKGIEFDTPATIVHIDTSEAWMNHMNSMYQGRLDGFNSEQRYKYVNLWKPIKGPVKKWPLMLCDWKTYDPTTDIIARDLVLADGAIETTVAYHNPNHDFYYLNNQHSNEAWIMVQSESDSGRGVPHTSFANPQALWSDPERESIEVRCMVYY